VTVFSEIRARLERPAGPRPVQGRALVSEGTGHWLPARVRIGPHGSAWARAGPLARLRSTFNSTVQVAAITVH